MGQEGRDVESRMEGEEGCARRVSACEGEEREGECAASVSLSIDDDLDG